MNRRMWLIVVSLFLVTVGMLSWPKAWATFQDQIESNCQVRLGYGFIRYTNSCYSGEVMTGARNDGSIMCSDISVSCFAD